MNIVGIDLGTTNSLVAVVEKGHPVVLPDVDGSLLIPSVVAFGEDGRPMVGHPAKALGAEHPDRMIYSVKRFMGRGLDDVKGILHHFPFNFAGSTEETIRLMIDGKRYTPVEISSLILRKLKAIAEFNLLDRVKQAVITVPAYFNDAQRQATITAGKLAGLDVLRLVNEPTAACLAYGINKKQEGIVAIYDLGGGTFDVSILKLSGGVFEVMATNGDTALGGDDFDRRLVEHLAKVVKEAKGVDLLADPLTADSLRRKAEQAKRDLSSADDVRVVLDYPAQGVEMSHPVTRVEFEAMIADLVERSLGPCRQALADAGLTAEGVTDVVLVGGSTRTPLVKRVVADLFQCTPNDRIDPDQVVALGAAVQADVLAGKREDVLLLDVVPLSLGIETMGGTVSKLIHRNTTIPTAAREGYTTYADNQTGVDIHVVQGERELVKDCRSLARFAVPIDPAPAGYPRIEVKFAIDANGVLHVTATDMRTGTEKSIEVKPTFGLSDEEVERMLAESIEHAADDMRARQVIDARNEGDAVIAATEKALATEASQALSADEREAIDQAVAALKERMQGEDPNAIRDAIAKLDAVTRPLAAQVMDAAVKAALTHKSIGELSR